MKEPWEKILEKHDGLKIVPTGWKTYTVDQELMGRLVGAAHSGGMLGGDAAYGACLTIGALLAEVAFKAGFDKSPGSASENEAPTNLETELREALQAQMDATTRLMLDAEFTAQDILDCTSQSRRVLALPSAAAEECSHDWRIWPETDGQSQRCMRCGTYRETP